MNQPLAIFILCITIIILIETTILLFCKHLPRKTGRRKIYVDTSSLIDGRILKIARSGFIDGDFIVLKSVLSELQLLADGRDSEKRARARAGLEAVSEIERIVEINVEIVDDGIGRKKVDEELLRLAKKNNGWIITLDYNLIKVAEAQRIKTLNVNDLALALRPEFLPGEKVKVKLVERGSGKNQAIAHLDDGTMVVVDKAGDKIGQEVIISLAKVFENSAGKMIFARIAKD